MTQPSPIGVSDLIKVLQQLSPSDDEARRSMAGLLGFAWAEPTATLMPDPTPAPQPSEPRPSPSPAPESPPMAPQTPKPAEPLATPTAQQMHSALTALEPRQTVFSVDALQRVQEEQAPYLPFAPLFLPNWTRAILAHALATLSVGGSLDIPKLIYLLAQGQPIVQLPNLPWPTLVRGVQVLMDLSEAMLPYRKDQLWLVDELEKTVGQDKVKILSFAAAPLLGAGSGPQDEWAPYKPPAPGTPVLALTDLGVGRPARLVDVADEADWLNFAAELHKAGCPLIVFTPYPPNRRPTALAGRFPIIHWDRTTTAALIRSLVGKGHKIL